MIYIKKQFTKKLIAGVIATVCCVTSVVSAYAVSSSDISCKTFPNSIGNERWYLCSTATPYTCTWIRVTSSAQKYPSGSALLPGSSTTKNNNSFAGHHRVATGYTDKMTVYGAHSMYKAGKSYIKYSTTPNI